MIYLWLTTSITLNVMFFTVIYFQSKDRKERIKSGLDDIQKILGELQNDLGTVNDKFEKNIFKKLDEIDQELEK